MKNVEDYDEDFSRGQNNCVCAKCGSHFIFKPDEVYWDEHGYGYSTKLVNCKKCGCINVVEHIEDYGFSNMNLDQRLYNYTR